MTENMLSVADIVLLEKLTKKADLINGKIPISQIPAIADQGAVTLKEVLAYDDLPRPGQTCMLYLTTDDSILYRWSNSESNYIRVGGKDGVTVAQLAETVSTIQASIPTKLSDLENDSGFITGMPEEYEQQIQETINQSISQAFEEFVFTESDPTVPTWAKAETKPSYTAAEVGALPDTTVIPTVPTKISAFENDIGYLSAFTETDPTVPAWAKTQNKPTYTAQEVGALPDTTVIPTVPTDVSAFNNDVGYLTEHQSLAGLATETYVDVTHNTNTSAHNDLRLVIKDLTTRLNTLADSDDTTLNQMSEVVAYIKSNKALIDAITTAKINVADVIDNLTTSATDKPLSAAQGVAIKALIDAIVIPTKTSDLTNDSGYITAIPDIYAKKVDLFSKSYNDLTDIPTAFNPSAHEHDYIPISNKGSANGVASLDANGQIPSSQLPSYFDSLLSLGETASTAYYGDKGKIAYDHSQLSSNNPHNVTAADVGLNQVANTGDSDIPVMGGKTKFTTGGAYSELFKKVDKVVGKELSTNDFTNEYKNKLEALKSAVAIGDDIIDSIINGTFDDSDASKLDPPYITLVNEIEGGGTINE